LPIIKISPDGIPIAFGSPIEDPDGVAVDIHGNVFVAGKDKITEIRQNGVTTTFLKGFDNLNAIVIDGSRMFVLENDGTVYEVTMDRNVTDLGTGPYIDHSNGLTLDIRSKRLLIADISRGRIVAVELATGTISTFVSGLDHPWGMAFHASGDLYVTAYRRGEILKISPDGSITGFAVGLENPWGLAFSEKGDLFVAESGKNRILRISGFARSVPMASNSP